MPTLGKEDLLIIRRWQGRSFSVPKSFGAIAALQRCLVTWQLANPWLHGLTDPYPVLYISIFKLPREYIYRGSKNNNNNTKTVRGGERGCDHGQHAVGVRDIVMMLPVGIVRAADSVEVTHITMSHTSARSLARYGMCDCSALCPPRSRGDIRVYGSARTFRGLRCSLRWDDSYVPRAERLDFIQDFILKGERATVRGLTLSPSPSAIPL